MHHIPEVNMWAKTDFCIVQCVMLLHRWKLKYWGKSEMSGAYAIAERKNLKQSNTEKCFRKENGKETSAFQNPTWHSGLLRMMTETMQSYLKQCRTMWRTSLNSGRPGKACCYMEQSEQAKHTLQQQLQMLWLIKITKYWWRTLQTWQIRFKGCLKGSKNSSTIWTDIPFWSLMTWVQKGNQSSCKKWCSTSLTAVIGQDCPSSSQQICQWMTSKSRKMWDIQGYMTESLKGASLLKSPETAEGGKM